MTCEQNDGPCEVCEVKKCPDTIADEKEKLAKLKMLAFLKIRDAERAAYAYCRNCEVGAERTRAFQIYENIRLSTHVAI